MLLICLVCGWIYDSARGDPKEGVKPGTPFESLPASWVCPFCKAKKAYFIPFINGLVRWDMGDGPAKTATMTALDAIAEEHRIIERMLAVLTTAQAWLKKGEAVAPNQLLEAVDFLKVFADRLHHGKEEGVLFPALESHGMARTRGPIGLLLQEHAEVRMIIKALADAIPEYERSGGKAAEKIAGSLALLLELYPQHTAKEDNYIFPRGGLLLGKADLKGVLVEFRKFDEHAGFNTRRKYLELVKRLGKELGGAGEIGLEERHRDDGRGG